MCGLVGRQFCPPLCSLLRLAPGFVEFDQVVQRLLRDRAEDIPELIDYFIKEAAVEVGSKVTGITDAAQTIHP